MFRVLERTRVLSKFHHLFESLTKSEVSKRYIITSSHETSPKGIFSLYSPALINTQLIVVDPS